MQTKNRLLSGVLITAVLIIAAIIVYLKIFKRDSVGNIRSSGERISVAVLPFQNMTNDTIWNIWQSGIQDILITSLSNYPEELIVRQPVSINNLINSRGITNYASITPAFAGSISQKLDANVFVYGNIKVAGSSLRIVAQLIDSETEAVFKSFQIEDSATEENIFQIADSISVMIKDFLLISKLMKEENPGIIKYVATTKSPEAFKNTIRGNDIFYKKRDYPASINMYMKAIAIDSNYVWPAIMISYAYLNQSLYDEGKKWLQKFYEKRDLMPVIYKTWVNTLHAIFFETHEESIKYMKQLLEIDDQLPDVLADIGYVYILSEKYSQAIPELEKGLEIYEKWGIHPTWVLEYTNLGLAYHKTGQYIKEKQLYKKAETDFPDSPEIIYRQAVLSLAEKDTLTANRYIDKYKLLSKENLIQDIEITTNLAGIYCEAGILDRAEEYYRKAILFETENPVRIYTLAYFLIDKDRNITEGLKLANNLLELSPDNYDFLYIKGLGLLKQDKYKEALEILQKSWDLRMNNAIYDHKAYFNLDAARKAVVIQN